jgi:hypothetical protein
VTKIKHEWTFLFRAPRGHQFFREENTGLVAIADDSGNTPDQTDDGILYLDESRPIEANRHGFLVPLCYRGKRSHTPASATEVKLICESFGLTLSVDGLEFVRKNVTTGENMTRKHELEG